MYARSINKLQGPLLASTGAWDARIDLLACGTWQHWQVATTRFSRRCACPDMPCLSPLPPPACCCASATHIVAKRIRMQDFIVTDYMTELGEEFAANGAVCAAGQGGSAGEADRGH